MIKNKFITTSLLLLGLVSLASCGVDNRFPRSFKVDFEVDANTQAIASQEVKEGYLISGVDVPTNDLDAIFMGWYQIDDEGHELSYFDIKTYRVFEDMTLKAKWIYPTTTPQEITLGSDAFTKSITWIQKNVSVNDIGIRARQGGLTYVYEYNANYDKNLVSGVQVEYPDDEFVELEGEISKSNDYYYKFTLDQPDNAYYDIEIYSKSASFPTVSASDIHFKGSGTEEDPYLVYNENDLKFLTVNSFDEHTYAKLMNDITIKSVYSEKLNAVFNGHLDGNKSTGAINTADNYSITLKNDSGLFMVLGEKAVVSNISFKGSISGSNPSIGVVANYSYAKISRIDSTAVSVNNQGGRVNDFSSFAKGGSGGIVGTNYGEITNCTITSARENTICGSIAVGGVAGVNYGKIYNMRVDAIVGAYNGTERGTTVNNSYSGCVCGINFGTVKQIDVYNGKINTRRVEKGKEGEGSNNVGGVVGYNAENGIVENCLFDGMRIVGDTNVGGIVGYNDGIVRYCYTGRRLRKPSNTTILERQFISPVIGSYNVGGIVGKCGETSIVTNVFSTANVWSYQMKGYTIAERAENAIGVMYNQHWRLPNTYLGQRNGTPYSNELLAPQGENIIMVDNTFIIGVSISWGLGFTMNENKELVRNDRLVRRYIDILGNQFGLRDNPSHGIRLMWESSVKDINEMGL